MIGALATVAHVCQHSLGSGTRMIRMALGTARLASASDFQNRMRRNMQRERSLAICALNGGSCAMAFACRAGGHGVAAAPIRASTQIRTPQYAAGALQVRASEELAQSVSLHGANSAAQQRSAEVACVANASPRMRLGSATIAQTRRVHCP